ncbi:MAG: LysR family transcriptional regulator [Sarcina sp.]
MELLQLKYFKSVAKHENITKAANELHISQPSLSITIKRLEDELSVPLFNRKGKTIKLNPYGEVFLTHVNSILNRIDFAKDELLELYGYKNTHLSISASSSIFLSGLLKSFLIEHSDITLKQTINTKNLIEKLKDRSIDFAIASPPLNDPLIENIELLEEDILAVLPKSHKLAGKKEMYLSELQNDDFISITGSYSLDENIKTKLFNNAGFEPNVIFEGDPIIIYELLELRKAVALAPLSVCLRYSTEGYTISKLKDDFNTRRISISYLKGAHLTKLAKTFLDFTINYYQEFWYTLENYRKLKFIPKTTPFLDDIKK